MKYCDTCNSTYPTDFASCPKDQSPLRQVSELIPGMIIREKYEILEKVGVGGMATVYKARHLTFNEIRAIKVVSNKLMDDQDFLRRFKTEAIITRRLRHANAVQLDDFDTTEDGRPFIVMEYVQGRNLRSMIRDVGALPVPRALNIARQVASALGAAHKLGIVHRDIKPDNILIISQPLDAPGGPDLVKVFDFGIAKIRDASIESNRNATQTGMVVGTPQYVSPEQASGKIGDQIDGRSDLYSLGVVLYEMLTGKLPFVSDTPIGFLIHHLQTPPVAPSASLPENVKALLMKALEKNRDRRFQTAEEMVAALSKPETVAPTRVMGSDTVPAVAAGTAPKAAVAPAALRAAAPLTAQPIQREFPSMPGTDPVGVGEGTVWDEKAVRGRSYEQLPWKKITVALGIVIVLLVLGSLIKQSRSNAARAGQDSTDEDARIRQDVLDAFGDSDSLKHDDLRVTVKDGVVVLNGRVSKSYESEIAGTRARSVSGVKDVVNEIEVATSQEAREPVWRSQGSSRNENYQQPLGRQSRVGSTAQAQVKQYITSGYARMAQRDFNGAESAFQRALALDPGNQAAQDGLRRAQIAAVGQSIFRR